jgi:hypothetical protein
MKNLFTLRNCIQIIAITLIFTSCDPLLLPSDANLTGTWKCSEQHEVDGNSYYDVEIETDNMDSTTIYIYNFLNLEQNTSVPRYITAHVNGNSISIPNQSIAGHTVEGSGNLSSDYKTIYLDFTDDIYGNDPMQVTATLSKY